MKGNWHHKRAVQIFALTVSLDVIFGVLYSFAERIPALHGMYCALGTATTVGCDIPPDNGFGYALEVAMMLTVVPLFAAVFSFFTSGLTSDHVEKLTDAQTQQIKDHVDTKDSG